MPETAIKPWWETRYDPEEPRDPEGKWTSGGGNTLDAWPAKALTDTQLRGVDLYTGVEGYEVMNGILRGEIAPNTPAQTTDPQRASFWPSAITGLDSAIAVQPLSTQDTTLYRTVGLTTTARLQGTSPGEVFTEQGYTSGSANEEWPKEFADLQAQWQQGEGRNAPVLEISVPAGSPGLNVKGAMEATGREEEAMGAEEVILPHGSSFEITRQTADRTYMRLLPDRATRSLRYSPEQPRDDLGRFTSGDGDSGSHPLLIGPAGEHSTYSDADRAEVQRAVDAAIGRDPQLLSGSRPLQVQFTSAVPENDELREAVLYGRLLAATTSQNASEVRIMFNDREDLRTGGGLVTATPYGLATHELGHATASANGIPGTALDAYGLTPEVVERATSRYGASNRQEGFAELYAYAHTPGFSLPSDVAAKFHELESDWIIRSLRYAPDQPRDDHGRWASTGGDDSAHALTLQMHDLSPWKISERHEMQQAIDDAVARHPELLSGNNPLTAVQGTSVMPLSDGLARSLELNFAQAGTDVGVGRPMRIAVNDNEKVVDAYRDQPRGQVSDASRTPYGMMTHELGHAFFASHGFGAHDDARTLMEKYELTPHEASAAAGSVYASASPDEALAEMYAMAHTPGYELPYGHALIYDRLEKGVASLPTGKFVDPSQLSDVPTRALRYSPDQPRDDAGRWTPGGGGDPIDAILAGARAGGASIHPLSGREPVTGYMVARHPDEGRSSVTSEAEFLAHAKDIVDGWLQTNADVFAGDNPGPPATGGTYIGVWHDTDHGEIVLDPSENIADRAEAVRLGVERDQQEIWDVEAKEGIKTGGSGGRQAATNRNQPTEADQRDDGRGETALRGRSRHADCGCHEGETAGPVAVRYSPDQPRDPDGRWTSGGSDEGETGLPEQGLGREGQPGMRLTPGNEHVQGVEIGFMNTTGDPAARVWNETAREITSPQAAALEAWANPQSYKELNDWARTGPHSAYDVGPSLYLKNLDAAIAQQAPTKDETVLYHYVTPEYASAWTNSAPGTVLTEPGYLGTTPDVGTALVFPSMAGYDPKGALLEIHAPAGTLGMVGDYANSYIGFREVVLSRGNEFKISDQPALDFTLAREGLRIPSLDWNDRLADPRPVRVDIVGQR